MKIKVVKSLSAVGLEKNEDISPAANLIAQCFEARTHAHIMHLQTSSYSQHMALDEFYKGIIPLVDAYAEAYQGRMGKIMYYPHIGSPTEAMTPIGLIGTLASLIDNTRQNCGSTPDIQNLIDSILELCNTTLYKLSNLK